MSRIFQTLGASKDDIPLLWIAAPLTGLLVQPVIGYMSDRTWHPRWGRRRPFFLIGAVLSSLALFFVPYSSALWMAAGFLWILDASINISMEPFRALVADKLPEEQRSYGFVLQTLIIGIGTWVASNLPWLVTKMGASNEAGAGEIPQSVYLSFAVGALVFMASILYTVFTTTRRTAHGHGGLSARRSKGQRGLFPRGLPKSPRSLLKCPALWRSWVPVQFFSWFAFFTMWSFATPALTEHVLRCGTAQWKGSRRLCRSECGLQRCGQRCFKCHGHVWIEQHGIRTVAVGVGQPSQSWTGGWCTS